MHRVSSTSAQALTVAALACTAPDAFESAAAVRGRVDDAAAPLAAALAAGFHSVEACGGCAAAEAALRVGVAHALSAAFAEQQREVRAL